MRFSRPTRRSILTPRSSAYARITALLVAFALAVGLFAQMQRPETHRVIAAVLAEPTKTSTAPPRLDQPAAIGKQAFAEVTDNAPFRSNEQDAWFATIAAVRENDWTTAPQVGYAELNTQPDAYRGRVVTISGRVLRVEEVTPAENDLAIDALWRATLQPAGGGVWPLTVYSLAEPPAAEEPYDAHATGVFFKKLSYRWAEGVGSTPVVVARELSRGKAPHAAHVEPPLQAQNDLAFDQPAQGSLGRSLLGELGVDLAALDAVQDRQPLTSRDAQAFYNVLGAVAATPTPQLVRLARIGLDDYSMRRQADAQASLRDRQTARAVAKEQARGRYSVVPLFGEGASERGELIVLDGLVRRAVRIDASGSKAAELAGVDHYYELELFSEDSQNLPVTFVVRDLPAGFPLGETIRQPARLAGFFFKQWAYRTRKQGEDPGVDQRQFAPLLIGRAPIALATPEAPTSRPGLTIGVLASVALLAISVAMWRLHRRDRQYETTTLSRYRQAADEELDFSALDESATSP